MLSPKLRHWNWDRVSPTTACEDLPDWYASRAPVGYLDFLWLLFPMHSQLGLYQCFPIQYGYTFYHVLPLACFFIFLGVDILISSNICSPYSLMI